MFEIRKNEPQYTKWCDKETKTNNVYGEAMGRIISLSK